MLSVQRSTSGSGLAEKALDIDGHARRAQQDNLIATRQETVRAVHAATLGEQFPDPPKTRIQRGTRSSGIEVRPECIGQPLPPMRLVQKGAEKSSEQAYRPADFGLGTLAVDQNAEATEHRDNEHSQASR